MQFGGVAAPAVTAGVAGVPVPPEMAADALAASLDGDDGGVPATGIAKFVFDGNGNFSGGSSVSLRGRWLQSNINGTYQVNSNCSVSFAVTDAAGATEHFDGVITGQGDSVFLVQTDTGAGVSGQFKRIRSFCQTTDVAGTYAIQYSGSMLGTVVSPIDSTGILSFDGQGNVAAIESRYSGGATAKVSSTGTVTVLPDCSVTISVASATSGAAANFYGVISSDTKQLLIVQSDAATAVKGAIVLQ